MIFIYVCLWGKIELECDKDYFDRHWTHDDEPKLFVVLIGTKFK